MNLENYSFTFEMDGQAVKYIYEALVDKHKRWAGGDAQQQADLEMLRDNFYRAYLDCILEKKAEWAGIHTMIQKIQQHMSAITTSLRCCLHFV